MLSLPPHEQYRLEQAAQAVSRSVRSSGRSIGVNWRRLASAPISEHHHVEYPGLTNEQIAIRETLDEAVRKVHSRQLDLSQVDASALQGTLEDILSDILDFMVHDAVASSSDNSDGGSGPESSDEDDDDEDVDNSADRQSMGGANGISRRHDNQSDLDHSDSASMSDSSDSDSESEAAVYRRQHHQHPHRHLHDAERDRFSRSSSQTSSSRHNSPRSRGFITIKRRRDRIPHPSHPTYTPCGAIAPLAMATRLGSPGTARHLPSSLPPSSSVGHGSNDGLLQHQRTEDLTGPYDEDHPTVISIGTSTPPVATLVSSGTGPRRRGAAASLVATLGTGSSLPPEEGKIKDGGSCCSTM